MISCEQSYKIKQEIQLISGEWSYMREDKNSQSVVNEARSEQSTMVKEKGADKSKCWTLIEKKNTGVSEKKPFRRGYQGNKPRGTGGVDIEQRKIDVAMPELMGSYFKTGVDQADTFEKKMKKLNIVVAMGYLAKMSCAVSMEQYYQQ